MIEIKTAQTVRLHDGGRGLYVTYTSEGHVGLQAASMRMHLKETQAQAVGRAQDELERAP